MTAHTPAVIRAAASIGSQLSSRNINARLRKSRTNQPREPGAAEHAGALAHLGDLLLQLRFRQGRPPVSSAWTGRCSGR